MSTNDGPGRGVLPIPDRGYVGLTTYDAKDPDTAFPPIRDIRPPAGAPNVLVVLIDDVGFAASSAFGGPINTPTAEKLAANGLKFNRFHTTALCSPTRAALLSGRNHHSVGMGGITEIATSAPGYNSLRPNTAAPLAETLKLNGYSTAQFGKCHEVPVWQTSPDGSVRQLALRWRWFRILLWVHRRRDEPVRPGDLPQHDTDRARPDARRGLPLHRGHDRQGHRLGPPAEGAHVRQAVLCLLRPRRDARAASRPPGVVRPLQGQVRRWLGRPSGADLRATEGARRHPRRCGTDGPAGRDPRLGRHACSDEADPRPPDGGLRRIPRAHRPQRRTPHRRARGPRDPGRHPDLLHHRGQRCLGRGDAERDIQRDDDAQRRHRRGDTRVPGVAHRQVRDARGLQPLCGRLGACDGHALPVDQAGRFTLGRHAERHDRPLARRDQGEGRDQAAVQPRHRRRADDPGRGRAAGADVRPRRPADATAGPQHAPGVRRCGRARTSDDAVLRDVRQPRHLSQGLDRRHAPQHAVGDGADTAHRRRRLGTLRPG